MGWEKQFRPIVKQNTAYVFMRVSLILIHNNFDRKGSLRRCGPGKPWQRLGAGDNAVGSVREEHGGNVHLNIVRAWW